MGGKKKPGKTPKSRIGKAVKHSENPGFSPDADRVQLLRSWYLESWEPRRSASIEGLQCPRVFAVLTWGLSASTWLACALNAHPDIFCVHAANAPWSTFAGARRLDGPEYLNLLAREGYGCIAAGDVHGLNRDDLARCRAVFGNSFGSAITVREPIARVRSSFGHFDGDPDYRPDVSPVQKWLDLGIRLPADTYEARREVLGIAALNTIELEWGVAKIWRSEDLTGNSTRLCEFIAELTHDSVMPDLPWADSIIRKPRVNSHGGRRRQLEAWHIEAIRKIVTPRAWDYYAQLGYPRPDFL